MRFVVFRNLCMKFCAAYLVLICIPALPSRCRAAWGCWTQCADSTCCWQSPVHPYFLPCSQAAWWFSQVGGFHGFSRAFRGWLVEPGFWYGLLFSRIAGGGCVGFLAVVWMGWVYGPGHHLVLRQDWAVVCPVPGSISNDIRLGFFVPGSV